MEFTRPGTQRETVYNTRLLSSCLYILWLCCRKEQPCYTQITFWGVCSVFTFKSVCTLSLPVLSVLWTDGRKIVIWIFPYLLLSCLKFKECKSVLLSIKLFLASMNTNGCLTTVNSDALYTCFFLLKHVCGKNSLHHSFRWRKSLLLANIFCTDKEPLQHCYVNGNLAVVKLVKNTVGAT